MSSGQDVLANTITVYNDIGTRYETAFEDEPNQMASLDWLLSHLAPKSNILDMGSGTGRPVASTLTAAGHSVLGIDISPVMVAAAREQVPAARFEEIDSRHFAASAEEYDAITAYYSYIIGVSQSDIREIFPKIYRWLKPGGLFVWVTVLFGLGANLVPMKWMGRSLSAVSTLSQEEMEKCIREAGFELIQSENFKHKPKAAEIGLCSPEDVEVEDVLYIYARKLTE